MRTLALGLLLTLTLLGSSARAQQFAIEGFAVAGGGGTSTNGQYMVSGTIGQPEAGGTLSGGPYAVTSGFWSWLQVVATPGAPPLRLWLTPTNTAVLAWPAAATGFRLQQSPTLAPGSWQAVTNAVQSAGAESYILLAPPAGRQFYRLYLPQ